MLMNECDCRHNKNYFVVANRLKLKCFNYSTNVDNSSRMKRGQDWSEKQFKFTDMVKNGDFAYKA